MRELVLRLEGVGHGVRRGRDWWQVLLGVSLEVCAGEFVGVLGGRGQGKTTLMEVAAGLLVPEEGRVWFGDRDLVACSDDERSELLGDRIVWMPQEDMADFRVLPYIAFPLDMGRDGMSGAEDRAREALKRVGVEGCEDCSWGELPDWERLMVKFARAYAARPALMVLDDVLDGLGAGGTREAGELLLELAGELQCGVLVAASDMSSLLAANRVMRFNGDGGLTIMADNIVQFPGAAEAG